MGKITVTLAGRKPDACHPTNREGTQVTAWYSCTEDTWGYTFHGIGQDFDKNHDDFIIKSKFGHFDSQGEALFHALAEYYNYEVH